MDSTEATLRPIHPLCQSHHNEGDLLWVVASATNANKIVLCLDDENLTMIQNIDTSSKIPCVWLEKKLVDMSVDHEWLDVVLVDGMRCVLVVGDLVPTYIET